MLVNSKTKDFWLAVFGIFIGALGITFIVYVAYHLIAQKPLPDVSLDYKCENYYVDKLSFKELKYCIEHYDK